MARHFEIQYSPIDIHYSVGLEARGLWLEAGRHRANLPHNVMVTSYEMVQVQTSRFVQIEIGRSFLCAPAPKCGGEPLRTPRRHLGSELTLSNERHSADKMLLASLKANHVDAAGKARRFERHAVSPRRLSFSCQCRYTPTEDVEDFEGDVARLAQVVRDDSRPGEGIRVIRIEGCLARNAASDFRIGGCCGR